MIAIYYKIILSSFFPNNLPGKKNPWVSPSNECIVLIEEISVSLVIYKSI